MPHLRENPILTFIWERIQENDHSNVMCVLNALPRKVRWTFTKPYIPVSFFFHNFVIIFSFNINIVFKCFFFCFKKTQLILIWVKLKKRDFYYWSWSQCNENSHQNCFFFLYFTSKCTLAIIFMLPTQSSFFHYYNTHEISDTIILSIMTEPLKFNWFYFNHF